MRIIIETQGGETVSAVSTPSPAAASAAPPAAVQRPALDGGAARAVLDSTASQAATERDDGGQAVRAANPAAIDAGPAPAWLAQLIATTGGSL